MNKKKKNTILFFVFFYGLIFFIFRTAFSITFFQDDFFFLKISTVRTVSEFLNFFSPIRTYSYKPLATEVFYFILHVLGNNVVIGHSIVFVVYFIGLFYLYCSLKKMTHNEFLSKLITFLYAIHFTHVFQLYWFATFQEIALFTFLIISFYYFLISKKKRSLIFFICALLSKETAFFYFPFLLVFSLFMMKKISMRKRMFTLIPYATCAVIFFLIYRYSLSYVTTLDNYKPHLSLRFLLNNLMWYGLWGVGFPNFMPVYFLSVFQPPIAVFWKLYAQIDIKTFFFFLASYIFSFITICAVAIIYFRTERKKIVAYALVSFFGFFIFIAPVLFFLHKWMVRLTIPVIFMSFFQGYVISRMMTKRHVFKILGVLSILLYCGMNYYGIVVHESSSLYLLETRFVKSATRYFSKNKNEIIKHRTIYFQDPPQGASNPWGSSKKLKNTFADQDFLEYFFPSVRLKAVYQFEQKNIPENACIVQSTDILVEK